LDNGLNLLHSAAQTHQIDPNKSRPVLQVLRHHLFKEMKCLRQMQSAWSH